MDVSVLSPQVEREHGLHLLRELIRIRRFEERCVELYSATKIAASSTSTSARKPSRSASWRR